MTVDVHTHTFPDAIAAKTVEHLSTLSHSTPFTDGSEGALRTSMRRAGIDVSVRLPVATSPAQVIKINDMTLAEVPSAGPGTVTPILPFAAMHPDFEYPEEELKRMKEAGIKGLKLHPPYQGAALNDEKNLRILRAARELDLVVTFHMGYDIGLPEAHNCTPWMLREVMEKLPGLTVIGAHMGGWREWDDVAPALSDVEGVFLDTSFSLGKISPKEGDPHFDNLDTQMLTEDAFLAIVRAFGAERILFGSDSPWSDQKESADAINALPLTSNEKALILGENAARLFRL